MQEIYKRQRLGKPSMYVAKGSFNLDQMWQRHPFILWQMDRYRQDVAVASFRTTLEKDR